MPKGIGNSLKWDNNIIENNSRDIMTKSEAITALIKASEMRQEKISENYNRKSVNELRSIYSS